MTQRIQSLGLFIAIGSTALIPNTLLDKFVFFIFTAGLLFAFLFYSKSKLLDKPVKPILIILLMFNFTLILSGINTDRSFIRILVGEWHRNLGLLHYFGLTALLIFTVIYFHESLLQKIIISLSWLGFAFILFGGLQFFRLMNSPNSSQSSGITLTLGNSNFAAVALVLTSTATLVGISSYAFLTLKFNLFLLSFILQVFFIFQTKTLQGIILFSVAISVVIFLRIIYNPKSRIRPSPHFLTSSAVGVVSITILILAKIGPDRIFAQISSSLLDRYYHWIAAANMLKSNPFFGVGIDAYGDSYRLFRIPEALILRGDSNTFANNAHNIYFQLGSTAGIASAILYLIMNFYVLWRGFNALEKNRGNFSIQVIFVLWLVFQIQLLISIDQLGLASWGWLLSGTIVAFSFVEKEQNNPKLIRAGTHRISRISIRRVVMAYGAYISVVGLLIIPGIRSEFRIFNSITKINSMPTQSAFQLEVTNLYDAAKSASQPALRVKAILELFRVQQTDRALELAKTAVQDFPKDIAVWDCLASIYEYQGNFEAAIPARRTTISLDPLNKNLADRLEKDLAALKQ